MKRAGLIVVVVVAVALFVAHALYFRDLFENNCVDDAYISFRYAQNFAHGAGLAFNRGEHVEGYSNFLWVLLLTPLEIAGADVVPWAQGLGIAFGIASMLLAVYALWRILEIRSVVLSAFIVLLVAGSGYFAAWSIGGLETTLFSLLLLGAWARLMLEAREPNRLPLSAPLLVGLALARPEGLFLALGGVALRLWLELRRSGSLRRGAWLYLGAVLGGVALYHAWRFTYYGPHLFPNAVRAKVGGGLPLAGRGIVYLGSNFLWPYLPLPLAAALFGSSPRKLELWSGAALLVGYLLFIAAAGGDWAWGRLFAPLLPLGALLLAAAFGPEARLGKRLQGRGASLAACAVAVAYLGYTYVLTSKQREERLWRKWSPVNAERVEFGKWLGQTMPPDAVLAVRAAGQIPYYSRLYTHDMLGLTDAHISTVQMPNMGRGDPGHERYDPAYTLEKVRPDIIVEGKLIPGLRRHALWRNEYQPVLVRWRTQEVAMHRQLVERLRQLGTLPGP